MKSSFKHIISDETPVLVDFFATWCGPCQTLAPILEEVKSEFGEQLKVIKVDVDKNQALATKFQVRGVPTMVLFKNGEKVWRQSGLLSKHDLTAVVQRHIN